MRTVLFWLLLPLWLPFFMGLLCAAIVFEVAKCVIEYRAEMKGGGR